MPPTYQRFWIGFTLSVVGDAMSRTALMWYVFETTGSATAVGLLTFAYAAPIAVGGLLAGRLLDRFDRRRLLILDNLIRGAAFATLPLAALAGPIALAHIYIVAAVFGLLMMISLAGSPTVIAATIPPELRARANAMEMIGFTFGATVGPALAGVLVHRIGLPWVIALDAATYLLFASLLATLNIPPPAQGGKAAAKLADAFHLLRSNRILLATTLMFMAYNIGGGFLSVALPVLTATRLRAGPEAYGTLLAAIAVGQLASSLLATRWRPARPLLAMICATQALAGLSLAALGVANAMPAAVLALLAFGAFSAPMTIWAQTLRMAIIPPELMGRSFALLRTIMQSGTPIGGAIAGPLLPLLGTAVVLAAAAGLVIAPVGLAMRKQGAASGPTP